MDAQRGTVRPGPQHMVLSDALRCVIVCQDATLLALTEQLGKDWVRICQFFGGRRTASNCSARWKQKVGGGLPPGGRKRLAPHEAGVYGGDPCPPHLVCCLLTMRH